MNQKTPEFIDPTHTKDPDSLFQDLGSELDFGSVDTESSSLSQAKKHPLEITARITDIFFKLVLVAVFIFGIDSTIRNLDNASFLSGLPVCGYLTLGVEGYDNTSCLTYETAKQDLTTKKEAYEKSLATSLAILIPKKLLSKNVLAIPEVQFIEQKNNRISITRALDKFNEIRVSSKYRGADIDCEKFVLSEKWEISTTCTVLGFGLSPGNESSETSRATALVFIWKLQETGSAFQVLESPKSLDLERFTSIDTGIRSTFSTQTVIQLKLRYIPTSKS